MTDTDNGQAMPQSISIDELNLKQHTRNLLKNADIFSVGDILETEQGGRGLLRVRNLGKAHYNAIRDALLEIGLSLDGTPAQTRVYNGSGQYVEPEWPVLETESPEPSALADDAGADKAPADTQPAAPETVEEVIYCVPVPALVPPPVDNQLKTVIFVDYEHWFNSLRKLHQRRPNIQAWFEDVRTRGRLLEVTFFGDFSDKGGMKDEINQIRRITNRIIETKNTSEHSKKNFTDFIILDNIYQKVITSPEIEQVILFTGDGDFCSAAAYLRNFCSKVVGVYGVDGAVSGQLDATVDWCVLLPFRNEPHQECREAILKNLKYAEAHSRSPMFRATVRVVAEHHGLPEDAVEAELRRLIEEGVVYTMPERSHWDYKMILNILKVNWDRAQELEA